MYLWIKALHIVSVISWMAGLLYLPRLMVYHAAAITGSVQSETFKVMERRLLRAIMTPAMLATWASGLYLAWVGFGFRGGWLAGKLVLVVALTVAHALQARHVAAFAADRNQNSDKYYRIINEIPTLLMIAIVVLVVVKPF